MADDVKTGILVEMLGKADFVNDLDDTTEAMNDAAEAADGFESSANNADSALSALGSGSAASTQAFQDNVEAAAWQSIANFLAVIDVVLEVNAAIIGNANATAEAGDKIAKGAKEISFSAEAYQRWDFILKKNNSSMDKAKGAITNLTRAAETGNKKQTEAFEALGLSMEEVQAMDPAALFETVVSGLQNVENTGERMNLANALFGGSYKSLGTLLSSSNEETDSLGELAKKLNQIMSDETVSNSERLMDATENLNAALEGIKKTFGEGLIDDLAKFREGLTTLITAVDWDGLATALTNLYTPAFNFLNDFLIPFATLNVTGITGLLSGLTKVLTVLSEVISGEKTAAEGMEELWTYGRTESDPYTMLKDQSTEAKNAIGSLEQAWKDFRSTYDESPGGVADNLNATALEDWNTAASTFLANVTQMAGDSENAAAANEWLTQQINDLVTATTNSELENPAANWDSAEFSEIQQKLAEIYLTYQQMLQASTETETDPAANAEESAEKLTESAEAMKSNAEAMLSEMPATTGAIVSEFQSGADEMSQAAADAVSTTNDTMASNMATLSGNAYVWGADMMASLATGILTGAANYVVPAVKSVASDIESMIGFSEPDVGPLSNFHTFAPDMMALFAQGIRDGAPLLRSAVGESFDLGPLIGAQNAGQSFNYGGVNVVIYGAEGQSADELYEVFSYRLQNEVVEREAAWR